MAQELIVRTWCDRHADHGEQVEGSPRVLFDLKVIDLCDPCDEEIVAPVRGLVERHGRALDAPPRGTSCPVCGKAFAQQHSLPRHLRDVHGQGERPAGSATRLPCPDCDFMANGGTGLAAHRRHKHGTTAPEGRVAARRQATG